jgi:hypothetical protein
VVDFVVVEALPACCHAGFSATHGGTVNSIAVLCHSDLERRNVLVRQTPCGYRLAAIVDWELSDIFPFTPGVAFKDISLGSSNLHFDWYTIYKSKTRALVAPGHASAKLIQAVRLIVDSRRLQ